MGAMHWSLRDDRVIIVADTLMTTTDGAPAAFVATVHPVPHLATIICGKGESGLISGWAHEVANRYLVDDFDALVALAPAGLRSIWADRGLDGWAGPSTVVMFGWSVRRQMITGFAFRSVDRFLPDMLPYGVRLCPTPPGGVIPARLATARDPTDLLLSLAQRQHDEARAAPAGDGVAIGGDIMRHALSLDFEGNPVLTSSRLRRLQTRAEDFARAIRAMTGE